MAILNHGSSIRTTDGGQTTTTIVTAANIGTYAVASSATYYIGTTQNVFNRASGAQTLTGVSIDGNAANITAYTINQNVGTSNTPSFAGLVSSAVTNYAFLQVTDTNNFWITPGNNNWGLYFETSAGGLLGGTGDSNRLGFVGAGAARFYVDLNNGNGWFGGSLTANTDSRAPIFYDSANTAYYIDPASTSIVNSFKVYDALYFGDYTTYLSQATPYLRITTANGYGNFGPANSSWFHMTTDRPNFYMAVGLHINGDLFIYNTQSQLTSTSVRAPIFYDSGDTTYYLDPANTGTSLLVAGKVGIGITSPLLKLQVDAAPGNPATTGTTQNGIFRISNSTDNAVLDFGMRAAGAGAWLQSTDETSLAANYPLLLNPNGANVGINNLSADTNLQVVGHIHVGNQTTFENTGGWNKTIYLDGTIHARMRILGSAYASGKNSATETNIWVDNSVAPYSGLTTNAGSFTINAGFTTLTNSARSPIFYDSDDTNYYVDPAGTSRVNTLYVANVLADSASGNGRILLYGNLHIDAYGAYDIYCNYYSGRRFRTFKGAGTGAEIFRTDTDGIVYAYEQLRTPILYDHNDTNYYLNPASSSVLNTLSMAGTITGALDATVSFTGGVCTAASYNYILNGANDTGNKLVIFVNGSTRTADGGVNALTIRNDGGAFVLGSASYLTSILGSSVTINGNAALTSASTLTAGNLSGTIPSAVLGNSTLYVGTTAIALNRGSASQSLTGVNIDGNAGGSSTFVASLGSGLNYDIDRTTKRSGLSHYSGYSSGTNRPTTYDYTLQVTDGGKGWEISMDWIATTGPAIYARSLRDCCQNWSSWVRILDSANYTYAANMNQYVRTTDNVTFANVTGAIFYDAANTAYYIDPASTSNLVGLTVANTITGSISGNAATATNSTQLGGVAAANYVRNDVDGTDSTALFRLTTITKSLTINTTWQDTGIVGANLATGCYMISVYVDNYAVSGGHYQETYTGMMSWFSTGTNSTDYDEIVLHKSGHASNGAYINLRTIRQLSGSTNLKLQIISSVSTSGASNYIFKFRRLI